MGIIISKNKKRECLSFIKSNFNKISQRQMAKILGLGKTSVNRWSKELDLKFKKHTVNEKFFDKWSEKSAYILGLIFSDGNINYNTKKGYCAITITAAEKDKEHLERIRKLLSSTKPLLFSSKTKSYRLIINSKYMCLNLLKLGLTPKKSLTLDFPTIPKSFLKDFVRGVIDGDGNVRYLSRKRSPYFEITVASGSKKFCEGFVKVVKDAIGVDANIRKAKTNTFIIQYSCSRGEKLAKYIYSNATIFLKRKYLPYKENVLGGK
ncbi:hypothetical protein AYK26_01225 [Euryarchaeota archaeon SM23-78]|nr:MAG: hypothetical protein AYK26_01225 [Euryarchaeota archaeon SM23-78]MBW3000647.1 hypothetical protein [Candidatus Woesearchaeota archaeon]